MLLFNSRLMGYVFRPFPLRLKFVELCVYIRLNLNTWLTLNNDLCHFRYLVKYAQINRRLRLNGKCQKCCTRYSLFLERLFLQEFNSLSSELRAFERSQKAGTEKIDQRVPTFDKTFFIKAEKNKNITSVMFLEQKDFVCYSFTNNVQVLFAESI